jgi:hypothetical protein
MGLLRNCLIIILIALTTSAHAASKEKSIWVTVEGHAAMVNITQDEARRKAVENALRTAIEQVVGVTVVAETLISNYKVSCDLVKSAPCGRVIEREILNEKVEQGKGSDGQPYLTYHVTVKARVQQDKGAPDPAFRVNAELNRKVFKNGEEMLLSVRPTKDAYITIFNLLEDDQVLLLYPNRYDQNNLVKAGATLDFPPKGKSGYYRLKVETAKGKNASHENIYLLATRKPVKFDFNRYKEGLADSYQGSSAFISDLLAEVVELPLAERSEQFIPYEVRKD